MSYYSTITTAYLSDILAAFKNAFTQDSSNYYANKSIYTLDKDQIYQALDYIGYKLYHALRMRRKYQLKKVPILTYMPHYTEADHMAAGLLNVFSMDEIKTTNSNTYDMLQRFLKVENL